MSSNHFLFHRFPLCAYARIAMILVTFHASSQAYHGIRTEPSHALHSKKNHQPYWCVVSLSSVIPKISKGISPVGLRRRRIRAAAVRDPAGDHSAWPRGPARDPPPMRIIPMFASKKSLVNVATLAPWSNHLRSALYRIM